MICFYIGLLVTCNQLTVQPTLPEFFTAIERVEGWDPEDRLYRGYLGPYQISYAYWLESEVDGIYLQCLDKEYSQRVMLNNWRLHIPEALENRDYETLARFHNGGPDGPYQVETIHYWELVKQHMEGGEVYDPN